MSDPSEDATLKAADFGLSLFYKDGQVFTELAGTARGGGIALDFSRALAFF